MKFSCTQKTLTAYSVLFCIVAWISQVQSYCLHNGDAYSVGQVWEVTNAGVCTKCNCNKGSQVRCVKTCSQSDNFPLSSLSSEGTSAKLRSTQISNNCELDGKIHKDRGSWVEKGAHARMLHQNECMECNCKVQVITCAIRRCPVVTCRNAVAQVGSCCKACPDRLARPPRTPFLQGCTSIDRLFQDKERWQLYLPSRNVFATCVDCSCQNGREHCRKHSCPKTKCSTPVKRPGDCCALCPGERSFASRSNKEHHGIGSSTDSDIFGFFLRRTEQVDTTSKQKKQKSKSEQNINKKPVKVETETPSTQKGCRFGNGKNSVYRHNELFNPVLNSRVQKCTKCVCLDSVVKCARIMCPARYPCSQPKQKTGFCCKVCPGMSDIQARNLEAVQMYQNRGCSRAKKPHVQVYRYNDVKASAVQLAEKYLFDKSHQNGDRRTEMHLLKLQHATINVTSRYLTNAELMRNSLDKNWHYLGAIKEKMFARFLRQERDLKICKGTVKCIQKMTHLVEQLKTRAARRRRCRSSTAARSLQSLQ